MRWKYEPVEVAPTGFGGCKLNDAAFTTHLNDLGDNGRELVSAFDTNPVGGATRNVVAVFKRPTQ